MSLQHQRCFTLLYEPSALDVLSEVFLEGDHAGTYTLEVLPVDKMEKIYCIKHRVTTGTQIVLVPIRTVLLGRESE